MGVMKNSKLPQTTPISSGETSHSKEARIPALPTVPTGDKRLLQSARPAHRRAELLIAISAVASTSITFQASATPQVYRAVVLASSLGPRSIESNSLFKLAYWPSLSVFGEGLRFRIVRGDTIIGTVLSNGETGPAGCRAMRWGPLTGAAPSGPATLPVSVDAIGTVATDGNDAGVVVGAMLFDSATDPAVTASAWQPTTIADVGGSSPSRIFGTSNPWCSGQPIDSIALAVGAADTSSAHNALATGAIAAVHNSRWSRSFAARVGISGAQGTPFGDGLSSSWCSSWPTSDPQIASFSQAVVPPSDEGFPTWQACYALGSRRQTVNGPTDLCVWTQYWDSFAWNQSDDVSIVEHCVACDDSYPINAPCVRTIGSELVHVSDVRLSSVAIGNTLARRSSAFAGLIEERRAPISEGCSSANCAHAHAAVVLDPIAPESDRRLFDLHEHVPTINATGHNHSGIARITSVPTSGYWIGVGATGADFRNPVGELHGCIWVGREQTNQSTQWCAFDADMITLRPPGIIIEAIHDITQTGVAVGIARDIREGAASTELLVLLTEPSDLNGDLQVNGSDLGLLLGLWGPINPSDQLNGDMNEDNVVNGADLGIFLGNWNWIGTGSGSTVRVECALDQWAVSNPIPISVAVNALGFASLDDLGEFARALPTSVQVQLCETVTVLAIALEGNN